MVSLPPAITMTDCICQTLISTILLWFPRFFSCYVINSLTKTTEGRKGLFQSMIVVSHSKSLEQLVTSHLQPATEHNEYRCSAAFYMLHSPRSTGQRMVLPRTKMSLSTSVNTVKIQTFSGAILKLDSPDWCAQRLVSWIILDSVRLATLTIINKTYIGYISPCLYV